MTVLQAILIGLVYYMGSSCFINKHGFCVSLACCLIRHVEEQYIKGKIIIRTLDIGGDKMSPALGLTDFKKEDNPFLGWRAIRFCL